MSLFRQISRCAYSRKTRADNGYPVLTHVYILRC
jgi:hypothetical protein